MNNNIFCHYKDYIRAIEYHIEHLKIAQELRDRVGEGRACWSLGNAQASLGNHEKALQYANKHLDISKEVWTNYDMTQTTYIKENMSKRGLYAN